MKAVADDAVAAAPSVRHVVVVSRLGTATAEHARDRLWSDLVGRAAGGVRDRSAPARKTR